MEPKIHNGHTWWDSATAAWQPIYILNQSGVKQVLCWNSSPLSTTRTTTFVGLDRLDITAFWRIAKIVGRALFDSFYWLLPAFVGYRPGANMINPGPLVFIMLPTDLGNFL